MTDRWPSISRVAAQDSRCTIILRDNGATTCSAHADGFSQALVWTAGVPGGSGNGHPVEGSVTHWARCAICNRLFVVKANSAYKPVSHRIDVSLSADTHLAEGDPTNAKEGVSTLELGGGGGSANHILLQIPSLAGVLLANHSVIKAELQLYGSAVPAGVSVDTYKMLRGDISIAQASWDEFKTGSAWGTSGATGATDRDTTKHFSVALAISAGAGYKTIMSGNTFRDEINASRDAAWFVGVYSSDALSQFNSVEAGSNKPILRLWYEGV